MRIRARYAALLAGVAAGLVGGVVLAALLTASEPAPPASQPATISPVPMPSTPVEGPTEPIAPAEPSLGAEQQNEVEPTRREWTPDSAREAQRRMDELSTAGPDSALIECLQSGKLYEDCQ